MILIVLLFFKFYWCGKSTRMKTAQFVSINEKSEVLHSYEESRGIYKNMSSLLCSLHNVSFWYPLYLHKYPLGIDRINSMKNDYRALKLYSLWFQTKYRNLNLRSFTSFSHFQGWALYWYRKSLYRRIKNTFAGCV